MARKKGRPFECGVVNEVVFIRLKNRRTGGFGSEERLFVQCDQAECQYVDENKAPCPLNLELFPEEVEERRDRARRRAEAADDAEG